MVLPLVLKYVKSSSLQPAEQPSQAASYVYGTVDDESFIHNHNALCLLDLGQGHSCFQVFIRTFFCDEVKQVYSPF